MSLVVLALSGACALPALTYQCVPGPGACELSTDVCEVRLPAAEPYCYPKASTGAGGGGPTGAGGGVSGLKANGAACTNQDQCDSNFCSSGVCCNTSCVGGCSSCLANQAGPAGTCRPQVKDSVCREAKGPCDIAEVCNGNELMCPADIFAKGVQPGCQNGAVCSGSSPTCSGACQRPSDCPNNSVRTVCLDGACQQGRWVFVSNAMFRGGSGYAAAKKICSDAAQSENLGTTFIPWLSVSGRSVAMDLSDLPQRPFIRTDNAIVAASKTELLGGVLRTPISLDEKRNDIGNPARVWTGTDSKGLGVANSNCSDWQPLGMSGTTGNARLNDGSWTNDNVQVCANMNHLYCFENP
jgi:hypothetical protein